MKDKEPTNTTAPKDKNLPVIKGIQKRDINAQPIGQNGTPNTNTRENEAANNMMAFPNPANAQLSLVVNSAINTQARIWMVKGEYMENNTGPDNILVAELDIPLDEAWNLSNGNNQLMIDLANVPEGYYRLYVEFNSYTLWDNIWVDK